jgi:hypothetical protein
MMSFSVFCCLTRQFFPGAWGADSHVRVSQPGNGLRVVATRGASPATRAVKNPGFICHPTGRLQYFFNRSGV